MATAVLNDIELYYEVHGSGDPLMLVAGLASDSQSWQPIIDDLASRHTVITFDSRGAGRTLPADAIITIQQMADDCLSLLDHLGIPSASLLGHSMGGLIAMDCAVRRPKAVDRLILAGISVRASRRNTALLSDWAVGLESGMDPVLWFRNIFYWVMSKQFFEDEAAVESVLQSELAYPYPINTASFRRQVNAIAAFDCSGHPSKISAKTMVIAGEEDLLFSPWECAELARAIPGAAYHLTEHAAHSLFMEDPEPFSKLVLDFLAEGKTAGA
jgi:pimeloyl-ACP methyl ester carboxylesterase